MGWSRPSLEKYFQEFNKLSKSILESVNKEVHKEATKENILKLRIVYVRKTQVRNKATNFVIETEEKTFS